MMTCKRSGSNEIHSVPDPGTDLLPLIPHQLSSNYSCAVTLVASVLSHLWYLQNLHKHPPVPEITTETKPYPLLRISP